MNDDTPPQRMDSRAIFDTRTDPRIAGGFTQIPNSVLRDHSLSEGARLMYGVLLSYAWGDGSCHPSQERLAADVGVAPRNVRHRLFELERRGLLVRRRRGLGATTDYVLTVPPDQRTVASGPERTISSGLDGTVASGPTGRQRPVSEDATVLQKKTQLEKTQLEKTQLLSPGGDSVDDHRDPVAAGSVGPSPQAVTTRNGNGHHPELQPGATLLPDGDTSQAITLIPLEPPGPKATRKRQVAKGARDREMVAAFLEVWQYQHRFYSGDDGTLPTCHIPNMAAIPKEGGDRWRLILGVMRHDAVAAVPGQDAPRVLYGAIEAFMVDARARESGWEADTFCRHVDRWIDKATAPVPGSSR